MDARLRSIVRRALDAIAAEPDASCVQLRDLLQTKLDNADIAILEAASGEDVMRVITLGDLFRLAGFPLSHVLVSDN